MGKYFSVAMVQMDIVPGDTEANVSKMLRIGEEAVADFPWVNLVLYSELVIPGFSAATWEKQAETIPGPTTERFAAFAKKAGVYVCPGSMFETDGAHIYNTAPVFGPDGSLVAKHRKTMPWAPIEPSYPGTEFTVFDIPEVGRIGLCICYDFWFPETCRHLAWMGAEVILHPTMTPQPLVRTEKIIAQANAIQNGVYMVSCSGCGLHGGLGLGGESIIVDPDGFVVEQMGTSESVSQTVLDLDRVALAQEYGHQGCVPMLKHLRDLNPELPMYREGNLANGDVYKKRKIPIDLNCYVTRRKLTLG